MPIVHPLVSQDTPIRLRLDTWDRALIERNSTCKIVSLFKYFRTDLDLDKKLA